MSSKSSLLFCQKQEKKKRAPVVVDDRRRPGKEKNSFSIESITSCEGSDHFTAIALALPPFKVIQVKSSAAKK